MNKQKRIKIKKIPNLKTGKLKIKNDHQDEKKTKNITYNLISLK